MDKFIVFIVVIIGLVIFFFTWKISNFFLSRKDFYVNSPYELLKIKLKMSATAAFTPAVVYILIFLPARKEVETNKIENNYSIVIYPTPNIKSEPIERNYKEKLYLSDSTKYFYKVDFKDSPYNRTGYVLIDSFKVFSKHKQ